MSRDEQEDAWHELMFLGERVKLEYPLLAQFWAPLPDVRILRAQSSNRIKLFENPYGHRALQDQDLRGHSQLLGTIAAYALKGAIDPVAVDGESRFVFTPVEPYLSEHAHGSPWRARDIERVQRALAMGDRYYANEVPGAGRSGPSPELP